MKFQEALSSLRGQVSRWSDPWIARWRNRFPEEEPAGERTIDEEFEDLICELGGEVREEGEDPILAVKDATIAGLRRCLEELQPVGELMTQAEHGRREATARAQALEMRCRDLLEQLASREEAQAEADSAPESTARAGELEQSLRKETAARERAEKRLDGMRKKYEERKKVAADRWRELRSLRSERRRIEKELETQRKRWEEARGPVQALLESSQEPPAARAHLADLLRVEPAKPSKARARKRSS